MNERPVGFVGKGVSLDNNGSGSKGGSGDNAQNTDDVCPECHIVRINGECMCDFS